MKVEGDQLMKMERSVGAQSLKIESFCPPREEIINFNSREHEGTNNTAGDQQEIIIPDVQQEIDIADVRQEINIEDVQQEIDIALEEINIIADVQQQQQRRSVAMETNSVMTELLQPCLICLNPVEHLSQEHSPTSTLLLLSKLFKVTRTFFQDLDLTCLQYPLYCRACTMDLNEALNILRDLAMLENKLSTLALKLQEEIVSSFHDPGRKNGSMRAPAGSSVERSSSASSGAGHDEVFVKVRKTLAQCWSKCQVGVVRIAHKEQGSNNNNSKKRKKQPKRIKKKKSKVKELNEEEEKEAMDMENNKRDMDFFPETSDNYDDANFEPSGGEAGKAEEEEVSTGAGPSPKKKRNRKKKPIAESVGILRFNHSQKAGKTFPFACTECGKGYLQQHFLDQHMLSHAGPTKFSCIFCEKQFFCERHLRLHEVNKHQLPSTNARKTQRRRFDPALQGPNNIYTKNGILLSFACEHCGEVFVKKDYLIAPNSQNVRIRCQSHLGCEKEFFLFSAFRTHHDKYCHARPLEKVHCDVCGKDFSTNKTLVNHMTSFHTKEFQLYCEICGVGSLNQGTLNRHMLCHSEKSYKCTICPKIFKRKMQLVFHMRRHTKDLLMCQTCGKTFANPQNLKNHELIHTGEKQFPCRICKKLFATPNYVFSHIWATHKKGRRGRKPESNSKRRGGEEEDLVEESLYETEDDAPEPILPPGASGAPAIQN